METNGYEYGQQSCLLNRNKYGQQSCPLTLSPVYKMTTALIFSETLLEMNAKFSCQCR